MKQFFKEYFFRYPSLEKITKEENKFILETDAGNVSINEDEIENIEFIENRELMWLIGGVISNISLSLLIVISCLLPNYLAGNLLIQIFVFILSIFISITIKRIITKLSGFPIISFWTFQFGNDYKPLFISLKNGRKLTFRYSDYRFQDYFPDYLKKSNKVTDDISDKFFLISIYFISAIIIISIFFGASFLYKNNVLYKNNEPGSTWILLICWFHLVILFLLSFWRIILILLFGGVVIITILVVTLLIPSPILLLTLFSDTLYVQGDFVSFSLYYAILMVIIVPITMILFLFRKWQKILILLELTFFLMVTYSVSFAVFSFTYFISYLFELSIFDGDLKSTNQSIALFYSWTVLTVIGLVLLIICYLIIKFFKNIIELIYASLISRIELPKIIQTIITLK
jgi:hypothetical protein